MLTHGQFWRFWDGRKWEWKQRWLVSGCSCMQKHTMQAMFQLRIQTPLWIWSHLICVFRTIYAAYQYLVTLSVTQVECERSFSTLKYIMNRLIKEQHWAGKTGDTYADVHGETDGQWHIKWRYHQPVFQQLLSTETAPDAMKTLKSRQYERIISFLHFDLKNMHKFIFHL